MPMPEYCHARRGLTRAVISSALGLAVLGSPLTALPASADLRICNSTPGRIGIAVGYQDGQGWSSEGWWNVAGQSCETLLKGKLKSRFYYVHGIDYDRGGEWIGKTTMCTDDKSFWIKGNVDCEARGHKSAGFLEIDTNDSGDWTIRLSDPVESRKSK
jgi:uncharacterized membrane protein